jgi:hypothetical protein
MKEQSMTKTTPSQSASDLFPWAVNHSLTEAEQCVVEEAMRQQPDQTRELHHAWEQVRTATLSQPQRVPAPVVRKRVLAQARAQRMQTALGARTRWLTALSGAILALVTLAVLWSVVQPGIGLHWSVNGAVPSAFRIYRAPLGDTRFEVVREVPARPDTLDYSFTDTILWPGQVYQYRIEAVNHEVTSATIAANGSDVLPLQLAIVLSSLMIGLAAVYLLRQLTAAPLSNWEMV